MQKFKNTLISDRILSLVNIHIWITKSNPMQWSASLSTCFVNTNLDTSIEVIPQCNFLTAPCKHVNFFSNLCALDCLFEYKSFMLNYLLENESRSKRQWKCIILTIWHSLLTDYILVIRNLLQIIVHCDRSQAMYVALLIMKLIRSFE